MIGHAIPNRTETALSIQRRFLFHQPAQHEAVLGGQGLPQQARQMRGAVIIPQTQTGGAQQQARAAQGGEFF
ncbi:hypothetical protein ISM_16240 [Roseovarius nubinhibens ISM]|uniref:Uncharacterized protein n=1 Tax=Roseovarius nubinhibens (strain ATCC BAA-591 / DSM 15170 / ISM) TaxID=89187 RepID=A3SPP2_ROSNI|nr:hypothetical protein ISM_16240 [Roseovarius nubinhibens ISM]